MRGANRAPAFGVRAACCRCRPPTAIGERKRSAMRRRGLWIAAKTRPAHSLQQKLGVVFLNLMLVSLAAQIGKACDDPPSGRKQSRPVIVTARPTMCCSRIIATHAPYPWRNGRNVEGSPWRLALAGTPSGFLCMEPKPNTQPQVCDEKSPNDQPECQGVEHGRPGYPLLILPRSARRWLALGGCSTSDS
jgi:hypothetical protein